MIKVQVQGLIDMEKVSVKNYLHEKPSIMQVKSPVISQENKYTMTGMHKKATSTR